MSSDILTRVKDKFVTVDGLRMRYIEEGQGPRRAAPARRVARLVGRCVHP